MNEFDRYLEFKRDLAEMTLKVIEKHQRNCLNSRYNQLTLVRDILLKAGKPLHIDEIIEIAQNEYQVNLNKDSIASAIAKKIKTNSEFIKTGPNRFFYQGI